MDCAAHSPQPTREARQQCLGRSTIELPQLQHCARPCALQSLAQGDARKLRGHQQQVARSHEKIYTMCAAAILCIHGIATSSVCRLAADLASIDRKATPWVVVIEHHPWYQTYKGGDYRSNECMRQNFEPLYYEYGVDVMFNGALWCTPLTHVFTVADRPTTTKCGSPSKRYSFCRCAAGTCQQEAKSGFGWQELNSLRYLP